mgnify:CR=1 FL=1|tara:strand:+ start:277 stop:483 length:207 start_codon:yes stop_codon:yes gene_type:complete
MDFDDNNIVWELKEVNKNLEKIINNLIKLNQTQLDNNSHLMQLSSCVYAYVPTNPNYQEYNHFNVRKV